MILETERLALRELDQSDFAALRAILSLARLSAA